MMKKVLVVDDEVDLVDIICDQVTELGYTPLRALDGKQGLEVAISENPVAIISDINMPRMDGLTMLEQLNQSPVRCPVIFITAYSDTRKIQQAWKLGAFDFLEKPVDIKALASLLKNATEFGVNFKKIGDPKDKKTPSPRVTLQLQLPENLINQVQERAKKEKMNVAQWIESLVTKTLGS